MVKHRSIWVLVPAVFDRDRPDRLAQNSTTVVQIGGLNGSTTQQFGTTSNTVTSVQIGTANAASALQLGSVTSPQTVNNAAIGQSATTGNTSSIGQAGFANTAVTAQIGGVSNTAAITQFGAGQRPPSIRFAPRWIPAHSSSRQASPCASSFLPPS